MPGRLFLTRDVAELAAIAGVAAPEPEEPRRNIQPGQQVLTLTTHGFTRMRWGMIPTGRTNARGRPVMETIINARSETVFDKTAYENMHRAVVPADGWYEWTGAKGRKTAWDIRSDDGDALWFAAIYDIWSGPGGIKVPQVATLTCQPSGDVRDIHDRMGVLLSPAEIQLWLTGDQDAARGLFRSWPDGRLRVTAAKDVDWSGP
ncbi:SOS response-associated peptidase [Marivita hallyeonensis]|uniref:Abasic site processing protein n=1 Tax=Marivita hallyeonensis TaxID=996342 RepID=A0A1M5MV43_9RHOB|nr:SOS response-associated peptidase [Marivita hallyeonensis]SHG81196.1 Putative SOS response-associated peptidase YedK [Marivita hallyeonensis]